ncbi:MAG: glycosyltransferase family 1 protein [Gammaproteobacteria bacterium]|nr:glycosyltransferase family 1 protein [Gammaproteobacteria bacterium]
MSSSPRVLFVPVSGPSGMGEFARARSLADALRARWPNVETHFVLHREAPYARNFHHPATLVPASPTLCTAEVKRVITEFAPQVVIFDNAGRTGALRAARRIGARVIYVSSRGRQRYKAFRLRWMRLLDEHWISYPAMIAGHATLLERLKLRLLGRPTLRFLDTVLAPADEPAAQTLIADFGMPDVLIVPGGGSQFHDSSMTPAHFAGWGTALAAAGFRVLFVAGPAYEGPSSMDPRWRLVRGVSGGALRVLLERSRLVLVNGGDTLLQALALGKACVAVPIAGDQAARIARCAELGAVRAPTPQADAVLRECLDLLEHEGSRLALEEKVRAISFADALPRLLERIVELTAASLRLGAVGRKS